jgi:hypothetical protein
MHRHAGVTDPGSPVRERPVPSTSLPGATRYYTSLSQIVDDVNVARIYTGFHYRSTLVRSNTLGIAAANWVNDNMMKVLPETPVGPDDHDNDGAKGVAGSQAENSGNGVHLPSGRQRRRWRPPCASPASMRFEFGERNRGQLGNPTPS